MAFKPRQDIVQANQDSELNFRKSDMVYDNLMITKEYPPHSKEPPLLNVSRGDILI